MNNKELLDLYLDYDKKLKRFVAKNKLYFFNFSLKEFEYCHNLFNDYPEVLKIDNITKDDLIYYQFVFHKLLRLLKLEYNLEVINNIKDFYNYALVVINEFQKRAKLCTNDSNVSFVPLNNDEVRRLREEGKYKNKQRMQIQRNKGTFENYFYEWFSAFTEPRTNILKYVDSVRGNLLEHGDTIEMIYSRDIVITLLKHYEYLSKDVTIEQRTK
jgi:hypothetical protein